MLKNLAGDMIVPTLPEGAEEAALSDQRLVWKDGIVPYKVDTTCVSIFQFPY